MAGETEAAADPPLAELFEQFESLGDNCEFGLVQRRAGIEPLGLIAFSFAYLQPLLSGLADGFDGIGRREDLRLYVFDDEYRIKVTRYGFDYHTLKKVGEISETELLRREMMRLDLLKLKLLRQLRSGEKILVRKGNTLDPEAGPSPLPVPEHYMFALAEALARYGPNTLLWVVEGGGQQPGAVEAVRDGLLLGHIDRFAPYPQADDFSFAAWCEICRNAHRLRTGGTALAGA
jgi:hypothetical protein